MTNPKGAKGGFSFSDYERWKGARNWEIIDGVAFNIEGPAEVKHQQICSDIQFRLVAWLRDQGISGQVFDAPTRAFFDEFNVVQPDVFVVFDPQRVKPHLVEKPDFIIEVSSPGSAVKDRREKLNLYESFGVREYLIIHMLDEYAERYRWTDGGYPMPELVHWTESLVLASVNMRLDLWQVFHRPHPGSDVESNR